MTAKQRKRLEWHAEYIKRLHAWLPDAIEEWEERAAIMEYDGGQDRLDAESSAFLCVLASRKHRKLGVI